MRRSLQRSALRHHCVLSNALICIALFASVARGQTSGRTPFWDGLDPGPHEVGFRSYWVRDWSRTWRPDLNASGLRIVPARPVRINVWYPARGDQAPAMRFGDYLGSARTAGFEAEEQKIRTADSGQVGDRGLRNLLSSVVSFTALMRTATAAHRDASLKPGRFPIVVYSLGQGDYTMENTPLAEYLASRGMIVISVAQLGTSTRRDVLFVHDPPSYDAQVRDLAFALADVLRRMPSADSSRIAAIGHSMGGTYALILALRHSGIQTVVGLDPSFIAPQPSYAYKFWEAPEFDPARFKGNLLALYRAEISPRTTLIDSLWYANRLLVPVPSSIHADFNGFPVYTLRGKPAEIDSFALARRSQKQGARTYANVTRYVGCYLAAAFAGPSVGTAQCPLPDGATAERLAAVSTPTEEDLYDTLRDQGLAAATRAAQRIATTNGQQQVLRRSVMQRIVDELGYAGRGREAAQYAELMAIVFPVAKKESH
jgi:pimeloyl-ACP methyl ester carboxylesterase